MPNNPSSPISDPPPAGVRPGLLRDPLLWVLALGLLWRLAFLFWTGFAIESDEATFGLMARHIGQLRELPVWFYGQEYMGALEAYAAAPWVKLLGAGPVPIKLTALLFWLAFALATAALARELFGRGAAAVFTCAWLALGPLMATLWSIKLRGVFSTMALGQLALLLAWRLGTRGASARGAAALGLVAGLGIWVNLLIAPFLAAAALFLVGRREFICRPRAVAAAVAGLALGAAPFWGYNLLHDWSTFASLFSGEGHLEVREHLRILFEVGLPILLGSVPPWDYQSWPAWAWPLLGLFAAGSLAFVWHARRGLLGIALPSRRPTNGAELWVLTALGFLACAALTRFGRELEPRYAIILYVFLAPAVGLPLGRLWDRGGKARVGAGLLAAALLSVNAWSIYGFDRRLPTQPLFYVRDRTLDPLDQSPLYRLLRDEGIDALVTDYWSGYRIIYETDERVTVAARDWARYAPYAEALERAGRRAWLFRDGAYPLSVFRKVTAELSGLGVPFRTLRPENYRLVIPDPGLDRRGWRAEGSGGSTAAAFDGDHATRWSTGADQRPGQRFEVDLGEVRRAGRLSVLFGAGDEPQRLRIETSTDGERWETVTELDQPPERFGFDLGGRQVRALRLTQLGERRGRWWSIQELYLREAP